MKKFFISFILIICFLLPSTFILNGCGKKPMNVSGYNFKYDSIDVNWKKGTSRSTKSSVLTQNNCESEKTLFAKISNEYKTTYQNTSIGFSTNGDFIFKTISGTYTQNDDELILKHGNFTIKAIVEDDNIQIYENADNYEGIEVRIIYEKSGTYNSETPPSTPSTPPSTPSTGNGLAGKTFSYNDVRITWAEGVSQTEKNQYISSMGCSNEEELFNSLKSMYEFIYEAASFSISFKENNVCDFLSETASYIQNGNEIQLTSPDEEEPLIIKIVNNQLELILDEGDDIFIITLILSETQPTSIPYYAGKTYSIESVTTKWKAGTTNQQKQSVLNQYSCNNETDLFNLHKNMISSFTLAFNATGTSCEESCILTTGSSFSCLCLVSENDTSIILMFFNEVHSTYIKNGSKLSTTDSFTDCEYLEQTIILSENN